MELLLTILFWIVAVLGGVIALPFVMFLVPFLCGLVAFLGIAAFFGSILITVTIGSFVVEILRPVTSWFRRTAGCK